ncbi:MAG: Ig-like domain-containing protein [Nitrospirota bacterium]
MTSGLEQIGTNPYGTGWNYGLYSAIAPGDGSILFGDAEGRIIRWTPSEGAQKVGVVPEAGSNPISSAAATPDGTVIFGSFYGILSKWTAAEGLTKVGTTGTYAFSAAALDNGTIFVCGGGHIYQLTPVLLSITPSSATIPIGSTQAYNLLATLPDSSTQELTDDTNTTWSILDSSIASINKGLVTGNSAGTTDIIASYGGGSVQASVSVNSPIISVTGVSLDKHTLSLIEGGSSDTLVATVSPSNATDKSITWSTDNPGVATVVNGVVTPGAVGTAIITVTTNDGGFTDSCTVSVNAAPPLVTLTGIQIQPNTADVEVFDTYQYHAIAQYTDGSTADVSNMASWNISDPIIASVDGTGLVTGLTVGSTSVIASYGGFNYAAGVEVKSSAPPTPTVTGLTITPDISTINAGQTNQFNADLQYSDGSTLDVTNTANWSTTDGTIINGLVSGTSPGTATITAESNGQIATATLITNTVVVPPGPISLEILPATASVKVGSSVTFTANVTMSDGSTQNVIATWSVNDPALASIGDDGKVIGLRTGNVIITATFSGLTANATLTITSSPAGGGGGGSSIPTPTVSNEPPPVKEITSDLFLARFPGSMPVVKEATKVSFSENTFTVKVSDPEKLQEARENGLTERVYYWNKEKGKWVALASYPTLSGEVKAINDGSIKDNVWVSIFAVKQPNFVDIKQNEWYEPVINRMNGLALLEGYPVDTKNPSMNRESKPQSVMTKAEFVTVVSRVLGNLPEGEIKLYDVLQPITNEQIDSVIAQNFRDQIPEWAKQPVATAVKNGLIKPGVFEGNKPISRIEAAMILNEAYKLANLKVEQATSKVAFKDADQVPEWAIEAVNRGILGGYDDETLKPHKELTRAESLSLILRLLQKNGW